MEERNKLFILGSLAFFSCFACLFIVNLVQNKKRKGKKNEDCNIYRDSQQPGGLPRWLSGKETACQHRKHRRCGFSLWLGRSPGGGNGSPLQCSCLENPMDRGAWRATVHRVAESHMTEHSTHANSQDASAGVAWVHGPSVCGRSHPWPSLPPLFGQRRVFLSSALTGNEAEGSRWVLGGVLDGWGSIDLASGLRHHS